MIDAHVTKAGMCCLYRYFTVLL